ncbi:MAG: peptide ABC transporter substrate-binding protein, partial [Acidobacteriota bacterium]
MKRILPALIASTLVTSCSQLEKPKPEPFFAETAPPPKQEFRWSNGKAPKSFDPAIAAAPPETDIVRAIFEGLTELDPKTLAERPAVAETWDKSPDARIWTFHLRQNAKWTDGRQVTADDFVRSWHRLAALGRSSAYPDLLNNIEGVPGIFAKQAKIPAGPSSPTASLETSLAPAPPSESNSNTDIGVARGETEANSASPARTPKNTAENFGVKAIDAQTLRVTLLLPDQDFPKLVAHPMFRPVADTAVPPSDSKPDPAIVTNGPFRVEGVEAGSVVLTRSENYWGQESVKLERVRFVAQENAETALDAYRIGTIDAVTNLEFSPLVLKLLEPYEDFRRTAHNALNFYEVNVERAPFNDRRVREALAIGFDRERLTEGELEGSTRPALQFLPFGGSPDTRIVQDRIRARELLSEAGYPDGLNFPAVKMLVNRNDTQQRIARATARMWKENLNIDTEIVVKENSEIEEARRLGEYDLVRRGVVLPTADETMSFITILGSAKL